MVLSPKTRDSMAKKNNIALSFLTIASSIIQPNSPMTKNVFGVDYHTND